MDLFVVPGRSTEDVRGAPFFQSSEIMQGGLFPSTLRANDVCMCGAFTFRPHGVYDGVQGFVLEW